MYKRGDLFRSHALKALFLEYGSHHAPPGGFAVLERVDQRQGHLALFQVAQDGLTQLLRRGGEVEEVVHELKRQPRIAAILGQSLLDAVALTTQHRSQPSAAAE